MGFLRKSVVVFLASSLAILLFILAITTGALRIIGNPEPVKSTLADSGIYDSVIPSALDDAQKTEHAGSEVPLTDPLIKMAAESAFTSQTIRNSTERVIDSIYEWLNGKTPTPDFAIDLTDEKAAFAKKVGEAAGQRAGNLPACPANQPPTSIEPFDATCLPAGVTAQQVAAEAESTVLKGQGFLEKPVIDASNFKQEGSNETVFNTQLKDAPQQYQRFKTSPFILAVLALLTILAITFLSATKRKGVRKVGIILLSVGVLMMIFAWGLNRVVSNNLVPKISFDNKVLQNSAKKIVTDITQDVDKNYWIFGGTYTALGVLAVGGSFLGSRGGKGKSSGPKAPEAVAPPPPSTNRSAYKAPPRPKKKIHIIQ